MTDNPNYKITFMLDSAAMITVHTPKRGVVEVGVVSKTFARSWYRRSGRGEIVINYLLNSSV